MAFPAELIRSGIALAKTLTAGVQQTVAHHRRTGSDSYGAPSFAAAVNRQALVEFKGRLVRRTNGEDAVQRAQLTFITPITALAGVQAGRQEPFDPRDKLVLADGTTGPILDIKGLGDPETDAPFMFEISLGGEAR